MASREELLGSIHCEMRLYKSFFMKIYGYELTWPGFAEDALTRLEILGCSNARNYYTCIVNEYNYHHGKELDNVAKWYAKQDYGRKKGVNEPRKQQEAAQKKVELLEKKKQLLLMKKQLLLMKR